MRMGTAPDAPLPIGKPMGKAWEWTGAALAAQAGLPSSIGMAPEAEEEAMVMSQEWAGSHLL